MGQSFVDGFVRVLERDIFAHNRDIHFFSRVLYPLDYLLFPFFQAAFTRLQLELFHYQFVQPLPAEDNGHLVDGIHIQGHDDLFLVNIAEKRYFLPGLLAERLFGPAQQDIGLYTDLPQLAHAVLGRLGLYLARALDERYKRQMYEQDVILAFFYGELPYSL